jgi:hypothetical protein
MSEKDISLAYDEDNSVKYIQGCMSDELKGQLSDDDIKYLVDLIYEYYDEKGFLNDDDADDDIEIDEEELVNYIFKNAKAGNVATLTLEQVEAVIEGEMSYCDTLEEEDEE